MTDTDLANERRAVEALRTGLRQQANLPAFRPLQLSELVGPGRPAALPRPRRWLSVGIAVAAIAAALGLVLPSLLGSLGRVPVPPGPTPAATHPALRGWAPTAQAPLSPRQAAVTAWYDGEFFLIGGVAADCDPGQCPARDRLADGAAYDPEADSWRVIAPAPAPVASPEQAGRPWGAVVGSVLYLLGPDALYAYDLAGDRWRTLALPARADLLVTDGTTLMAIDLAGELFTSYQVYDPAGGRWERRPVDFPVPGHRRAGAAAAAGRLVLWASTGSTGAEDLHSVTVDLATGEATAQAPTAGGASRRDALQSFGDLLVWRELEAGAGGNAWLVDPVTGIDRPIGLPDQPGGLRGPGPAGEQDWWVTTGGAIGLRGQLYTPATGAWTLVPPAPLPAQAAVVAGGRDSVLACFGRDQGTGGLAGDCFAYPVPSGASATQTPQPGPTPSTSSQPGRPPTPTPLPTGSEPTEPTAEAPAPLPEPSEEPVRDR